MKEITETETENFPVGYSVGYFTLLDFLRHVVGTLMGKKTFFSSALQSARRHITT